MIDARQPLPPWPSYDQEQIDAVTEVLRSGKVNYWTGQRGRQFEKAYAASVGCDYGIALANGTLALELALHVLDIGPGDDVIVTPRSFIASASCVAALGANPVFADVDADSQGLTAKTIEAALTPNTRAVIPVHLAGWPCPMDEIMALAERRDLKVIEDCAQAHGAAYRGRPVGSFGHVAAFSFCQDKIITTGGEGGLVVTNDAALWSKGWSFKDHGKSFDAVYNREHPPGFRWLHESIGTNWRLTEMQAAIGQVQLARLPDWHRARQRHAALLDQAFIDLPALRLTRPPDHVDHAYYRHYVFVRPDRLRSGWSRDRIMSAVVDAGFPCFSGSCSEIYREKAFGDAVDADSRRPVARELGATSLAFLVHPTLSTDDIEALAMTVKSVVEAASR